MQANQDKNLTRNRNQNETSKLENISEVLGLLVEAQKDKEWLTREIRRNKLKLSVNRHMNTLEILKVCPSDFIDNLLRILKNEDFSDRPEIPILTKTFHWFYTDIVGSSNPLILTKEQARKVWVLNELIGRTDTFKQRDQDSDVMQITGDGMAIGFSDSPEKPLRLAIELHKALSKYNKSKSEKEKMRIRVGIDTGPVYFVKDLTGKDNFWGPGVITTKRVMDLARPMQVLASERIANDIRKLSPQNKSVIHSAGVYKIKHGEKLTVYNVYGDGWGNKRDPLNKINEDLDTLANPLKFLFPRVEVRLEITNPKNMMTHHIWIWNLENITEQPIEQISYFLGGDVPREFPDLNVTVRDENNTKLKIVSINVNKPYTKEFIVKLDKPIKPNQKRRLLKLEYDWEEPERKFGYTLASDCKKFQYLFSAPKSLEVKQRVLKIDPATHAKIHASPPPNVKYLNDCTEITWQATNLHSYDSYQFEW